MGFRQSVNSLLENYVLQIAAEYIDMISPEDQTRLMNLVNDIGRVPHEAGTSTDLPVNVSDGLSHPFKGLEQQWQEALSNSLPPAKKPDLSESLRELLQGSLLLNQREIEATLLYIGRMAKLIERAETTRNTSGYQNGLIQHYRTIQGSYTTRLEQLESFQERRMCLLRL
jgi:hypothetical protein